jgi:DNA-binding CsgD family transcriptional regulator
VSISQPHYWPVVFAALGRCVRHSAMSSASTWPADLELLPDAAGCEEAPRPHLRSRRRPPHRHTPIHRIPLPHHRALRRALQRARRHPLRDLRHLARPPHHAQSRNHPRNGRGEGSACPRGSPHRRTLRSQYAHQQTLGITTRELEILTLVARGFSNREIATQRFVSENTVKTYCARAFDKLGAARRTQAVRRRKELGLLL